MNESSFLEEVSLSPVRSGTEQESSYEEVEVADQSMQAENTNHVSKFNVTILYQSPQMLHYNLINNFSIIS